MNGNSTSEYGEKDDEHSLTPWAFRIPIVENQVRCVSGNGENS